MIDAARYLPSETDLTLQGTYFLGAKSPLRNAFHKRRGKFYPEGGLEAYAAWLEKMMWQPGHVQDEMLKLVAFYQARGRLTVHGFSNDDHPPEECFVLAVILEKFSEALR